MQDSAGLHANEDILVTGEYDLGRNSDGRKGSGLGHPLLHAGVRVRVAPQLTVAFFFKDLLTQDHQGQVTRELSVRYTEEL
jgi:hypothetical protein